MVPTKKAAQKGGLSNLYPVVGSALTGFETTLRFVDHVNAAFAAHDTAIAVAVLERTQRVFDLHWPSPVPAARGHAPS